MKGEIVSTIFLRLVIIFIGVLILALCIFLLPFAAKEVVGYFPANFVYPTLTLMYLAAIPFYFALYQALKLLSYIDRKEAFSDLSVNALKRIKYSAVIISILHGATLPFLYLLAEFDDAPGLILMGMVIPLASFVIAVFAALLQKLLKNAIDIKRENDLTV